MYVLALARGRGLVCKSKKEFQEVYLKVYNTHANVEMEATIRKTETKAVEKHTHTNNSNSQCEDDISINYDSCRITMYQGSTVIDKMTLQRCLSKYISIDGEINGGCQTGAS